MDSLEIHKLGKELSKSYLSEGVPLTEGLQKVASDSGLNNNQIQRVAESANVETYLTMLKNNNGGYIDFDLAQPQSVKTASVGEEEPLGFTGSRDLRHDDESWINELFPVEDTEKIASADPHKQRQGRQELRGQITFISNNLQEGLLDIEESLEKIAYTTGQYIRSGEASPKDVASVIYSAAPHSAPFILDQCDLPSQEPSEEKLASVAQSTGLWKTANHTEQKLSAAAQINQILEPLQKRAEEWLESTPKEEKAFLKTAAKALEPVTETAGAVMKFIKDHPFITGASIGIPLYWAGKSTGNSEAESLIRDETITIGTKPKPYYPYG